MNSDIAHHRQSSSRVAATTRPPTRRSGLSARYGHACQIAVQCYRHHGCFSQQQQQQPPHTPIHARIATASTTPRSRGTDFLDTQYTIKHRRRQVYRRGQACSFVLCPVHLACTVVEDTRAPAKPDGPCLWEQREWRGSGTEIPVRFVPQHAVPVPSSRSGSPSTSGTSLTCRLASTGSQPGFCCLHARCAAVFLRTQPRH